jgi:UDP-N-acetylmuramoyl-tripeptide--D-alanyl-D-alanine ligase
LAELGHDGPGYHREAGAEARRLGIDELVGVGELARDYGPDRWAADAEAAVPVVEALIGDSDAVLVKGSRSVSLELFTDTLTARMRAATER